MEPKASKYYYKKGNFSVIENNDSENAIIYTDKFKLFNHADLEELKKLNIHKIAVYVLLLGKYVPFRSSDFETPSLFSKGEYNQIHILLIVFGCFLFTLFFLMPEIFQK